LVYARTNPTLPAENPTEMMVVELGTWKQERLDVSTGIRGCAVTPDGTFYYVKQAGQEQHLFRADLAEGTPREVLRRKAGPWGRTLGTVSSDHRYYATGVGLDDRYEMFGVLLIDLASGQEQIIDRAPDIFNAHPQFEPGAGKLLMIQHNRGGKTDPDPKKRRSTGPEGATLYLLSLPEGKRIPLEIGTPYTTACTGHEAWIGATGEIVLTVSSTGDFVPEKGNMLAVRPGGKHRVVGRGYRFGHVGATRCGRFFSGDDCQGTYRVVIGSTQTGRTGVVCESHSKPTRAQNTHVHPYLTPDVKWVIFNSYRTGFPHVWAASVPEGLVAGLQKA